MSQTNKPLLTYFPTGWEIFKQNFVQLFFINLLLFLPVEILSNLYGPESFSSAKFSLTQFFITFIFVGLVVSILNTIPVVAIIKLVESSKTSKKRDIKKLFNFAFTKWWLLALTRMLWSLVVFPLYLLLIVPGVVATIYLSFTDQIVVIENKKFWQALKLSFKIVKGHWWFVAGATFLLWFPTTLFSSVTYQGAYNILTTLKLYHYFIPHFLGLLVSSYGWVVYTLFYLDFRNTKQ